MNHLINEKSPYLLEHSDNPVDWYPWCDEAFNRAQREDKPIFLSIGYSACHWCHVMEYECFRDMDIANILNQNYISIKVDREEMPHIDNMYMKIAQRLNQNTGWPLSVFMTYDKKPFFIDTYIPKVSNYKIGIIDLLPNIIDKWRNNKYEIYRIGDNVLNSFQTNKIIKNNINETIIDGAYAHIKNHYDSQNGGFFDSPKFPMTDYIMFLFRYYRYKNNKEALKMAMNTLRSLSRGGIYDHLGYGFHRYTVDKAYSIPHFEKMIYTQAMLIIAYSEAYQINDEILFRDMVRNTSKYVLNDMCSREGLFYTAEDGDSEGIEGKYYKWDIKEIESILDTEEYAIFNKVYYIVDGVLSQRDNINTIEKNTKINELFIRIENINKKLLEARNNKTKPFKDTKAIVGYNGLVIAALSKAYSIINDESYLNSAIRCAEFILDSINDSKLKHMYYEDSFYGDGDIVDYSYFIYGLIELYQSCFDMKYLEKAIEFMDYCIDKFFDKDNGGFFFVSRDNKDVLVDIKESFDESISSPNSIMLNNLLYLYKILNKDEYLNYSKKLLNYFTDDILNYPLSHISMIKGFLFLKSPIYEVTVVGSRDSEDTNSLIKAIKSRYISNCIILLNDEQECNIDVLRDRFNEQKPINDKATAYVCKNNTCKEPTNDKYELLRELV